MSIVRPQILFAWGQMNDPHIVLGFVFVAGICFLYAENISTRIGGVFIALASALRASGPQGDSDNWIISVAWLAIAIVCIAINRPGWLQKKQPPVHVD